MSGYVYLIGSTTFGWYKIGKSKIPEIRVATLGILLPFKLEVIGVWKAENHTLLEKTLHELYGGCRINGEWFEFSKEAVARVFERLPSAALVYPIQGKKHALDSFSNLSEDRKNNCKKPGKVLGLRVQKLRGDFTPEEREARRIVSMKEQKLRKEQRAKNEISMDYCI